MAVKVVSPPDCEVTVEAVDREKQTPIKGARVVMHPYRAMTDENGIARLKVTKGHYDILVSASKYVPVSITVEVTADMITRAELDVEPPWESPDEDLSLSDDSDAWKAEDDESRRAWIGSLALAVAALAVTMPVTPFAQQAAAKVSVWSGVYTEPRQARRGALFGRLRRSVTARG